ncbi:MAG: hypothetical protein E7671_00915 [Ruminococcaceae bacterium]|nr:hypothetical protein [Oscillospiraceae bacterium]
MFCGATFDTVKFPTSGNLYISASMFSGCKNLKEVVITANTKQIGGDSFTGCTSLERAIFLSTPAIYNNGEAFRGCTSLEYISSPKSGTSITAVR